MYAIEIYSAIFAAFTLLLGIYLNRKGRFLLGELFKDSPTVGSILAVFLNIGWYLVCIGLLLWNIGIETAAVGFSEIFREVALRLGISIFVVGVLHFLNVLTVAVLSRKTEKN